jgi:hypothetical protein|tara:strand:+ start:3471 stop:3647 length:177 start_codon:yes stop_codon:yes gene_type:complete
MGCAGFTTAGSGVLAGSGSAGTEEHPESSATKIEIVKKLRGSGRVRRTEDLLMLFTFL